jgi:hypothetical protein
VNSWEGQAHEQEDAETEQNWQISKSISRQGNDRRKEIVADQESGSLAWKLWDNCLGRRSRKSFQQWRSGAYFFQSFYSQCDPISNRN